MQYQINNSEVNFSNAKFWGETATLYINSIKNRIIVKREIQFENLTLEQEKRRKDKWWYNLEVNLSESRLANKYYFSIQLNIQSYSPSVRKVHYFVAGLLTDPTTHASFQNRNRFKKEKQNRNSH